MSLVIAVLLGVIQGVFMFVPVSSTSHLVLAQTVLRGRGVDLPPPDSPEMVLFDLVVHVGTLVSIVVVMRAGLRELSSGVRSELRDRRLGRGLAEATSTRFVLLGLVSVAVTGVLGLAFQDSMRHVFGTPTLVALALAVTGALLWWTDSMTPDRDGRVLRFGWRGPAELTLPVAVGIGVAQAVALVPGVSRSGTTIFAALLFGLRRTVAARYSFYIAIPTILAATGFQTLQVGLDTGFVEVGWGAMLVGFIIAAVVGSASLWLVLRLLEQARFRVFSLYVWALALATVAGLGLEVGA